ncbi:MAG TPA: 16S rRNA (adenine(1518)-N(6)/adenine(1519)-N(6))-dimethyltransferase RsmA [Thermoplasmata archaeon]|nr:16S rRNA (adenine(1518)-N(6)/adenine(1519)-N(6))-dimethyltransferase RsmA [Thermoplasmata archaeon]
MSVSRNHRSSRPRTTPTDSPARTERSDRERGPATGTPRDPSYWPGVPHRAEEVRERLAEIGLRPSRSRGQSFLTDPFAADIEVAFLEVRPGEPIIEIGGGLGVLTEALARRGLGPVRVIERDPRLVAHLRRTFGDRVAVDEADALETEYAAGSVVVGNLPFSVASPILTRLFESRVRRVVALLQKEVGERYAAGPGGRSYGRPAIQAALFGTTELGAPVPASSFEPKPAVDGVIVRFTARDGPLPVPSVVELERVVRQLFSRRRKQLANLLPGVTGGEREAREAATAAGWPAGWEHQRPEELAPAHYFALACVLSAHRRGGRRGPVGPVPIRAESAPAEK